MPDIDRSNSAETVQKSTSDNFPKESLHHVCLCIFLWGKVFMMQSKLLQYNSKQKHFVLV